MHVWGVERIIQKCRGKEVSVVRPGSSSWVGSYIEGPFLEESGSFWQLKFERASASAVAVAVEAEVEVAAHLSGGEEGLEIPKPP